MTKRSQNSQVADPELISQADLDKATTRAVQAVKQLSARFSNRFPSDCTERGKYSDRPGPKQPGANLGWTTGFRTGTLWLANLLEPAVELQEAGLADIASFGQRLVTQTDLGTHDIGFLYLPSCVAGWRQANVTEGRVTAIGAAGMLMERVIQPAGIFQAWGALGSPEQRGRAIIDSLMNMPLLYWASTQTGDGRYCDAANRHVRQLRDHLIREDSSTYHTFYWHTETGEPLGGATAQGYSDSSCWARGQAWAIYGFALDYQWNRDPTVLQAAIRCADYWLDHQPADMVPYWDLVFAEPSSQPRDSSAAAIAACGLIELAGLTEGEAASRYRTAGLTTVRSLIRSYVPDSLERDGLIEHGVYDIPTANGVDEANLWGDYFYLEALVRLNRPDWVPYWLTGLETN